jgi:hypothetical protein
MSALANLNRGLGSVPQNNICKVPNARGLSALQWGERKIDHLAVKSAEITDKLLYLWV